MRFNFSPHRSPNSKYPDRQYQKYLFTALVLFSMCLILKTLLDLNVLLSTGRLVSTQDWVDLMFAYKEKIALNSPLDRQRILIISGSNSSFGLSAKTISSQTGLPTINLGSHAGLGGAYILKRAEKMIRKGDVVLLPLEYEFYSSSGISDDLKKGDVLARFLISYDQNSLRKIPTTSIINLFFSTTLSGDGKKEYMNYFRGHLEKKDIWERLKQQQLNRGCYSGYTFNDYGDETCNIGYEDAPVNPAVIKTAMPRSIADIDPGGYIRQFVQFATNKGAKIVPLYPVSTHTDDYQDVVFDKSAQKIKKYWIDLGIEFKDSLKDSLLPPNLMFDGFYHPRDSGRTQRTKSVIALIKNCCKSVQE